MGLGLSRSRPRGTHFSGFGPPLGATPFVAPNFNAFFSSCFFFFEKEGQKTETPILAKVGLAKVGHPNFGQSRSIEVGQRRQIFLAKVGLAKVELAKVGVSRGATLDPCPRLEWWWLDWCL